ncbi:MAG: 2-deoxyribose-5-phosphate aldolase [Pyrobaculum sp.]|jgi:deoxyribose-phosphate aldolase
MFHLIDYAMLKPYLSLEEVARGAEAAERAGAAAFCVNPVYARAVRQILEKTRLCVVVDFPFGCSTTAHRAAAVSRMAEYVDEFDVVAPLAFVKSKMWSEARRDLISVVGAAGGRVVKVIVEEPYLTREERLRLYELAAESGAHFIKSSTGFLDERYVESLGNRPHATVERAVEIASFIKERGYRLGVKMAGGIRTWEQVKAIVEAVGFGEDPARVRIGTSTLLPPPPNSPQHS